MAAMVGARKGAAGLRGAGAFALGQASVLLNQAADGPACRFLSHADSSDRAKFSPDPPPCRPGA